MENKRIICNLPLRGEETEFLSTNRVQAEKILNQQCSRYFRDEETKPVILKAFKKLFDNNHAKLLRDLPVETVNKILSKEVQHHIPWRGVFKESVSTPAGQSWMHHPTLQLDQMAQVVDPSMMHA